MQIVGILLALISAAHAVDLEAMKTQFMKTTELRETLVEKYHGDPECLEYNLEILTIDGQGTLTLMMGDNILLAGIGGAESVPSEKACKTKNKVTYGPRKVVGKRTVTCGQKVNEFNIAVTVERDGFQYTQVNKENGRVFVNRVCKYTFK